jgi:UPF0042 nucleotide-binding protein
MVARIVSFGFKFGTPVDADLVLDVRFLDNPHFVPELKPLSGLDEPVAKYVLGAPETQEFLRRTRELLEFVMPRYEREGKSYLTIAVGCTGGRHRSVAVAEALARGMSASLATSVGVIHRDIHRGGPLTAPPSYGPDPHLDAEEATIEEPAASGESATDPPRAKAGGGRS